jgi:hypothetical protein
MAKINLWRALRAALLAPVMALGSLAAIAQDSKPIEWVLG